MSKHNKHDDAPATTTNSDIQSAPGWTWTLIVAIFATIILIVLVNSCNEKREVKKAEAAQKAAEYAATHRPALVAPPVIKIGKEPTTHQFDSSGCIEVWLRGNWVSYPQPLNTEIFFYDQHGRLVLKQGVKKQGSSLPAANYRICRAPGSNATGVQVWN